MLDFWEIFFSGDELSIKILELFLADFGFGVFVIKGELVLFGLLNFWGVFIVIVLLFLFKGFLVSKEVILGWDFCWLRFIVFIFVVEVFIVIFCKNKFILFFIRFVVVNFVCSCFLFKDLREILKGSLFKLDLGIIFFWIFFKSFCRLFVIDNKFEMILWIFFGKSLVNERDKLFFVVVLFIVGFKGGLYCVCIILVFGYIILNLVVLLVLGFIIIFFVLIVVLVWGLVIMVFWNSLGEEDLEDGLLFVSIFNNCLFFLGLLFCCFLVVVFLELVDFLGLFDLGVVLVGVLVFFLIFWFFVLMWFRIFLYFVRRGFRRVLLYI